MSLFNVITAPFGSEVTHLLLRSPTDQVLLFQSGRGILIQFIKTDLRNIRVQGVVRNFKISEIRSFLKERLHLVLLVLHRIL